MSINSTTPEMWDALRKKHSPIENVLHSKVISKATA
jgi:hypothetical protein